MLRSYFKGPISRRHERCRCVPRQQQAPDPRAWIPDRAHDRPLADGTIADG